MRTIAITIIALCICACATTVTHADESAARIVIMVRHAEKADDDPKDPTLSHVGQQRALDLAHALSNSPPTAIFVSPYRRTQLTAAPAAEQFGIAPTVVPIEGDAEQYALDVAAAIAQVDATGTVLVVGHSNTIPPLIGALGGHEPTIGEKDYKDLFILHQPGPKAQLIHARYGSNDE